MSEAPPSLTLHAPAESGRAMARALGARRGVARPLPPAPAAFTEWRFVGDERRLLGLEPGLAGWLREGAWRQARHSTPGCVIRLEGDAEALGRAALRLAAAGATLPAPAPAPLPTLDASQTPGEALALLIGALGQAIRAEVEGVCRAESIAPVHAMRVAVRRLRSALGLFRGTLTAPALAEADAEAKALMRLLSPARDWDVFLAGPGAALGESFADAPEMAALLAAAQAARAEAYAALRVHLAAPGFAVLTVRLAWLAAAQPWTAAEITLPDLAARRLARRWRRMEADAEGVEALPLPALHALRLQAKRMRYACEFLAPLFPGHGARRWVRRLTRLQDRLGRLNDLAVAAALMARLGPEGRGFAAGIVCGHAAAGADAARAAGERAWRRLRRLEVFWD